MKDETVGNAVEVEGEAPVLVREERALPRQTPERDLFIDNLLVQIHFIIEMMVDRPRAKGVWIPYSR